ncbi:MAG: helix-turn-helix domain-containing protein [Candidatus Paceibacterota bacterium]|jgi:ATP-dependent exoDNAse (exonuclease V) alpha subunit
MTQKEALNILKTGRNVFLTGAAGSGKTHILREYINYLRDLNAQIGITASTGIAATHMGGTTIHSWSGVGIRDNLSKSDIEEIAEKKHIKKNISEAKVLVIDEISMLHHFRLDLIEKIIKKIKNSDEPFGGMQVVFCGDFFQLPPVRKSFEPEVFFAYHSETWKKLDLKICYLSEQHRQNDLEYLKILNAVRDAKVSNEILEILNTRFNKKPEFEPTKLYSHNRDVNSENETELEKISGKVFEYEMQEKGRPYMIENLQKSCLAPKILRLKVGAKIMFVKNNFEEGFVNGTLGVVVKCTHDEIHVKTVSGKVIEVEQESWRIEEEGKSKAEITQYPLRLAWAITVHKSQGMSLDSAEIDLSASFERGMGYVALSRVRSLAGLFLKGLNEMALKVNEEVLEFDKKFRELSETSAFHIKTMGDKKLSEMHETFAKKVSGESKNKKEKKLDTVSETKKMLDDGKSLKEIAKERGLKLGSILDHIEKIKEKDPNYNIYNLRDNLTKNKFKEIYNAFRKIGIGEGEGYRLAPVKEILGAKYSYEDLRLVRLFL